MFSRGLFNLTRRTIHKYNKIKDEERASIRGMKYQANNINEIRKNKEELDEQEKYEVYIHSGLLSEAIDEYLKVFSQLKEIDFDKMEKPLTFLLKKLKEASEIYGEIYEEHNELYNEYEVLKTSRAFYFGKLEEIPNEEERSNLILYAKTVDEETPLSWNLVSPENINNFKMACSIQDRWLDVVDEINYLESNYVSIEQSDADVVINILQNIPDCNEVDESVSLYEVLTTIVNTPNFLDVLSLDDIRSLYERLNKAYLNLSNYITDLELYESKHWELFSELNISEKVHRDYYDDYEPWTRKLDNDELRKYLEIIESIRKSIE